MSIQDPSRAEPNIEDCPQKGRKRRDLHFRVSDREYQAIRQLADQAGESIATIMRRVIRQIVRSER